MKTMNRQQEYKGRISGYGIMVNVQLSFLTVVILLMVCGCGSKATEKQAVEKAVTESYDALLAGRYADYAAMLAGASSRSADYNEQLAANAAMFIEEQQRLHTSIVDVRVADVRIDHGASRAQAFVVMCYGDSTNEEIVLPLVKEDNVWKVQ